MDLQDFGSLAEILSAVAVLVSLVYLATQIRQNTIALRQTMSQSVAVGGTEFARSIYEDPDLSDLFFRGVASWHTLSASEQNRMRLVFHSQFRLWENLYFQHLHGVMDDEAWEGWNVLLIGYFHQPGIRAWWDTRKQVYARSFRDYLESTRPGEPSVVIEPKHAAVT
ncbi:MAG: hypothetical protein ACT4O1_03535 [Gemmatimonadota bacterium]